MKNKLLEDLRKYHSSLRTNDGKWKEIPDGIIAINNTSDKNIERIKIILTTILSSDGISEETKIFLSNPDISMRLVNSEINKGREQAQAMARKRIAPLSYNNTIKKISDDNARMLEVLDINIIRDIVYNRIEEDKESEVDSKIEKFVLIFGTCDKSRNNLVIKLNDNLLKKNNYCNNEEFFDILSSIECYLQARVNIVEKALNTNTEFVEYFNYLLNSSAIHDKECYSDRERLLKFLHNDDYSLPDADDNSIDDNDTLENNNDEHEESDIDYDDITI